jgi:hypothetical protein
MIATRTRDALKRAKARGVRLGGQNLAQARKAAVETIEGNADRHAGQCELSDCAGTFLSLHNGRKTPKGEALLSFARSVSLRTHA